MIVWSVVNIEEWEITRPMARQLSQPPMGQTPIPDMPNWTWYEYGMRVGFWRLKRALEKAGVTPTMSINAKVCETYPEVAAAARDADWEFMAHSYVQMPIQQIEDQRAVMRQSVELIERFTGKKPTGWLGPGRGQTYETLDYATECGFTWFGDWVLDDQPFWVRTANGPILSVPYSAEINDITLMVSHHHESDVLLKRTADAFDRLYQESAESTRVLAIGVHPYVTGAAHRIKYFEQLYEYIDRHDGVIHWTGQQIHDWYAALVPPGCPDAIARLRAMAHPGRRRAWLGRPALRFDFMRATVPVDCLRRREKQRDEQAASDICVRTLRPYACAARRDHPARGHRSQLRRLAAFRYFLANAAIQGIRNLRNVAVELHDAGEHGQRAVRRHSGVSVAGLPPRLLLHQYRQRASTARPISRASAAACRSTP